MVLNLTLRIFHYRHPSAMGATRKIPYLFPDARYTERDVDAIDPSATVNRARAKYGDLQNSDAMRPITKR